MPPSSCGSFALAHAASGCSRTPLRIIPSFDSGQTLLVPFCRDSFELEHAVVSRCLRRPLRTYCGVSSTPWRSALVQRVSQNVARCCQPSIRYHAVATAVCKSFLARTPSPTNLHVIPITLELKLHRPRCPHEPQRATGSDVNMGGKILLFQITVCSNRIPRPRNPFHIGNEVTFATIQKHRGLQACPLFSRTKLNQLCLSRYFLSHIEH